MSVIIVAEFPMTEQGAQDFIDWSKNGVGDQLYATKEEALEAAKKVIEWF